MQNWDDLRFLLAVHHSGSMSAAARDMGTNVATVSRRLERLGQDLGGAPFVKTPSGWKPSRAAEQLIEVVETFNSALQREKNATTIDEMLPTVRLGVTSLIQTAVLQPQLRSTGSPVGKVEMEFAPRTTETGLGTNDIVIQIGRPDAGRISVRKAGTLRFDLYRWKGVPIDRGWLSLSAAYRPFPLLDRAQSTFAGQPFLAFSAFDQLFSAARDLRLPAPLPEVLARREPELERVDPSAEWAELEYWVLYHLSRRGDPALQLVSDWIVNSFRDIDAPGRPQQTGT